MHNQTEFQPTTRATAAARVAARRQFFQMKRAVATSIRKFDKVAAGKQLTASNKNISNLACRPKLVNITATRTSLLRLAGAESFYTFPVFFR